jgi:CheY-like chemotaxis protein
MIDEKARPRVLVIDDEAHFLYAASFVLRMAGFNVTEASSGQEGLDMVLYKFRDGITFDLILLDLIMPRMTGLQLIDEIRELKISSKVLIITGVVEKVILQKAKARGSSDVLFKPFNSKELLQTVDRILGRKTPDEILPVEFHDQGKPA